MKAITIVCYMAVSHKDLKLPNPWIWLAEINIDCSLDLVILVAGAYSTWPNLLTSEES